MYPDGAHIVVTGKIDAAEEGGFVSLCPELGIASQGESIEEASENLAEAIEVFIESLLEDGELDDFLRQRGIPVLTEKNQQPKTVSVTPGEYVSALVATVGGGRSVAS